MLASTLLSIYIFIRTGQYILELSLAAMNYRYCQDPARFQAACTALSIAAAEGEKTRAYARDRFRFSLVSGLIESSSALLFIALGGIGYCETWAQRLSNNPIVAGLSFFAGLSILSGILSLPFEIYTTFVLEAKHGFNRQTPQGFFTDKLRGIALGSILGGLLLSALLWIIGAAHSQWWLWAWGLVSGFTMLVSWLYPTLLAPLFNSFTPLEDGDLKAKIDHLAARIGFAAKGISIMDASRRTAHGNAYFTGIFGKKRIVLFDTLVKAMTTDEVVAVLAHELGHFQLKHVRSGLIRSLLSTGIIFYLLHLVIDWQLAYSAFGLSTISAYGALIVFALWFGPLSFCLQPLANAISRRHEFQADAFAMANLDVPQTLSSALRKLRETSHSMPLSHPLYSRVYHSHPPLLERLQAMSSAT